MSEDRTLEGDCRELHDLLQKALILELSTIPPYATACYSIKEEGQYDRAAPEIVNAEPIEVLRQVMVEEMLHMVLVANVMNAIGGRPTLNDPKQLPHYPQPILDGKGPTLHLRRFTPQQIKAFREVERASHDPTDAASDDYDTIGEFYLHTIQRLKAACCLHGDKAVFTGHVDRQIGPGDYYGAGGKIIVVDSLESACTALEEILEEGEGAHHGDCADDGDRIPGPDDRQDIAHFFKFNGILHSRYYFAEDPSDGPPSGDDLAVDWRAVWPMRDDPKPGDYDDNPEIASLDARFNATWSALLDGLDAAFNDEKKRLAELVPLMYRLKQDAQRLMRVPLPDTAGQTAGPTWQYIGKRRLGPSVS